MLSPSMYFMFVIFLGIDIETSVAQVGYGRCPGLDLVPESSSTLTASSSGTTCHNPTGLLVGQKCYLSCTNGYRLEANRGYENSYYSCESRRGPTGLPRGVWVPEDGALYCQRIRCAQLPDLSNTTEISPASCYQGPSYLNTQCNFRCKEGYKSRRGVSSIRCLADDTWSSPLSRVISCQRITCERLPNLPNAEISPPTCSRGPGYLNTQCSYSCNEGYVATSGVSTVSCLFSEAWSSPRSTLISCERVKCDLLPAKDNGYYYPFDCADSVKAYGDKCELVCDSGYEISTQAEATCQANGTWDVKSSKCERPAPKLENVKLLNYSGFEIEFSLKSKAIETVVDGEDQIEVKICQRFQDQECIESSFDLTPDASYPQKVMVYNDKIVGKLRIWIYHISNVGDRSKPDRTDVTRKPNLPDRIRIVPQDGNNERAILTNWKRPVGDYSGVEIQCTSDNCCEDHKQPIIVPAEQLRHILTVKAGTDCMLVIKSFITENENSGRRTYSNEYMDTVATVPIPPKRFNLTYTRLANTRNIMSASFHVNLEVTTGNSKEVNYKVFLSIVNTGDEMFMPLKEFNHINAKTGTYTLAKVSNHPQPGALYKADVIVIGARDLRTSPLTSYTYISPYPPENFTITSDLAFPIKTFEWIFHPDSIQDELVIKFCQPENHRICVYERFLEPVDNVLPLKYLIRPRLPKGTYAVYLIARSGGENSSASNYLSVTLEYTCRHPDGLNGQIISPDETNNYYSFPGDGYVLKCDEQFKLVKEKETKRDVLTWTCLENGQWIKPSKCTEIVTSSILLATVGGILAFLIIVSAIAYFVYKFKVKSVNKAHENFRQEIKQLAAPRGLISSHVTNVHPGGYIQHIKPGNVSPVYSTPNEYY